MEKTEPMTEKDRFVNLARTEVLPKNWTGLSLNLMGQKGGQKGVVSGSERIGSKRGRFGIKKGSFRNLGSKRGRFVT